MTFRVFFYVQHLLGIGHLMRSFRVARALARHKLDVTIVSGGVPMPAIDTGAAKLIQLPPVKSGAAGFSDLVHPNGSAFTDADKIARRDELLRQFQATRPHALITEAFPFGRRQMRFELLPLLDLAKQRHALIAASIRDILQEQKNLTRSQDTVDLINRYYDVVFVHGTPDFATLDHSFALVEPIRHQLIYTGMVGPEDHPDVSAQTYDVIVSAGGGAVGANLIRAALQVCRATSEDSERWLMISGPNMPVAVANDLEKPTNKRVERVRFVADLPALLKRATISISQAGYNTVADLLAARCRSVLVPFDEGGETEQSRRGEILARRRLAIVLPSATLSPESLRSAISAARALPQNEQEIDLNGANRTCEILLDRLRTRFSGSRSA
jgi:predicted glycosyltransferase